MPVTVCFDTSLLMMAAKFHIDVVSEAERVVQKRVDFAVPELVVRELERLAKSPGPPGRDARVALELISTRQIHRMATAERSNADRALIEASKRPNLVVATADSDLRRTIRDDRKPVIFLREKAKLELDGIEPSYW